MHDYVDGETQAETQARPDIHWCQAGSLELLSVKFKR